MQNLDKYLSESEKRMLKFLAGEVGLSEVKDPDAFKKVFKRGETSPW